MKLTARIVDWNAVSRRGHLKFEKHHIPLSGDDFVVKHKQPEVGDMVEFRIARDAKAGLCAVQVEHCNDGGRIRLVHLGILLGLLVFPLSALWQMAGRNDWRLVLGCALGLSAVGFLTYWLDKLRARHGQWRVAESTLHFIALAGGWPGAFLAQRHFGHKTGKLRFQLLFWMIITVHQFLAVDYLRDWTVVRSANAEFMRVTMPAPK